MEKTELRDAFSEFKNLKNIDRPTMMGVLEDVFRTQLAKTYGSADNFDIIINIDKGDCEIYWNREVVDEVENPNTQIAISEVNKDSDEYEIGETYATKVEMKDFGRRGILNIRQNARIVNPIYVPFRETKGMMDNHANNCNSFYKCKIVFVSYFHNVVSSFSGFFLHTSKSPIQSLHLLCSVQYPKAEMYLA